MLILGQVRLSKGKLCPAGLKPLAVVKNKKNTPPTSIIFNKPRSSIKPRSVPDPNIYKHRKSRNILYKTNTPFLNIFTYTCLSKQNMRMTAFITAKLKKTDGQTNIDK